MTQLYISTAAMVLSSLLMIISVVKISNIKLFMYRKDSVYMQKFEALETMIKGDIKTILKILKNESHRMDEK